MAVASFVCSVGASQVRRAFLFLTILLCALSSNAQKWGTEPHVMKVCEKFVLCGEDLELELTEAEDAFFQSLLKGIPSGASEAACAKFFGRQTVRRSPSSEGSIQSWRGTIHRSTWLVDPKDESASGDHVDVYFINGKAFMMKWWFSGMKKMVQLGFVE
ncbi:MAG: hypothetical protein CFE43_21095 [Burkholderiales bacterium PBB3]|nr:MAG: hypothetical protein CFE43_21095 [Burkholderiales bacterium PBB3]